MSNVLCYSLSYKFIFNNKIPKYSIYNYQKLFRALYGYEQNINKKSNKIYKYKRKGVLSYIPYIKNKRNNVIIPIGYEENIINFFKTGENPAHIWKNKEKNWFVEYTLNKVEIDENEIVLCLKNFINNYSILSNNNTLINIYDALSFAINNVNNKEYIQSLLKKAKYIIDIYWFKNVEYKSSYLTSFNSNYLELLKKIE